MSSEARYAFAMAAPSQSMWIGEQRFLDELQRLASRVFRELGTAIDPLVRLVGVPRAPGSAEATRVLPQAIANGVLVDLSNAIDAHLLSTPQVGFLGSFIGVDRRTAAGRSVLLDRLRERDKSTSTLTFCALGRQRLDHDVYALIEFDRAEFDVIVARCAGPVSFEEGYSLLHAAAETVLQEADEALERILTTLYADAAPVIRRAGERLLAHAQEHVQRMSSMRDDLFLRATAIAAAPYEGKAAAGRRLLIARADDPDLAFRMRFAKPVPLAATTWARKVVEIGTPVPVVTDGVHLLGVGSSTGSEVFTVAFTGGNVWELRCDLITMMRVRHGVPTLARAGISKVTVDDTLARIFPALDTEARDRLSLHVLAFAELKHGALLVISDDAEAEAKRLEQQCTRIEPAPRLDATLIDGLSRIDGAVLLGTDGRCHAVGVILDGIAAGRVTAARGARFNSAVRYVAAGTEPAAAVRGAAVALVKSEDGYVDLLPRLRRRVTRAQLDELVKRFAATQSIAEKRKLAAEIAVYAERIPDEGVFEAALDTLFGALEFGEYDVPADFSDFDAHASDVVDE